MGKGLFRKSWRPAAAAMSLAGASLAVLTGCKPPAVPAANTESAPVVTAPTKPIEPVAKKAELAPSPVIAAAIPAPEPPPPVDPPLPEPEPIASSLEAAALSRLFEDSDAAEAIRLLGKRVELTGYVLQVRNLGPQRLVVLGDEHFTSDLPAERVLCHIEQDMSESATILGPRLRVTGTCQLGYGNLVVLRNCKIEEELPAMEGFEARKLAFAAKQNHAELERLGVSLEGEGDQLSATLSRNHFQRGHLAADVRTCLGEIAGLKTLRLSGLPISDEGLAELGFLNRLQEISLDATRISAGGLAALDAAKELRHVTLDGSTLNEGFAHLSGATNLESLELASNQGRSEFSEEAARHLAAIRGLKNLTLDGAKLTPAVMNWIAQQTELETLSLEYTPINAELLTQISGLIKLKSLKLRGSQFDDNAVSALNGLTRLERLDLSQTQLSDQGLSQFVPSATLKEIDLAGTRVVGSGLAALRNTKIESLSLQATRADNEALLTIEALTTLKQLRLGHTKITAASLGRLAALQNLEQLDLIGIRLERETLPVLEGLAGLRELRLSENPFKDCDACLTQLSSVRPELKLFLGRYDYLVQSDAAPAP